MKRISDKQHKLNREVARIKAAKPDRCVFCGMPHTDAAHLLPRSLYPEYYTAEWNIVPMCRTHHTRFDNDRTFRSGCTFLYNIVRQHDELAAYRHFTT